MHRLPVTATVGAAYRFLSGQAGTIIRLAWFPLLIVAAAQYYGTVTAAETALARLLGTPDTGGPSADFIMIAVGLVQIVGGAMVGVALHQLLLFGDDRRDTYILFSLGRTELLFMVIPVVAVVLAYFGAGLLVAVAAAPAAGGPSPLFAILLIAIAAAAVYLGVRLTPLYPVIVVGDRFDLGHAFDLSRGNFWRIFTVMILGFLPVVIVLILLGMVSEPIADAFFSGLPAKPTIEAVTNRLRALAVVQTLVGYVVAIAAAGVGVALVCFTYKGLRGLAPEQLLTREYEVR